MPSVRNTVTKPNGSHYSTTAQTDLYHLPFFYYSACKETKQSARFFFTPGQGTVHGYSGTLAEYQPFIIGAVLLIIFISFKNETFRNWVIRLMIFALIISIGYFGFHKVKYKFRSGQEVNPFNEQVEAEENAGMKYYRDPAQLIDDQTK